MECGILCKRLGVFVERYKLCKHVIVIIFGVLVECMRFGIHFLMKDALPSFRGTQIRFITFLDVEW